MKVSKKLLSIALVVMLLLSAVPFQAFAAGSNSVTVVLWMGSESMSDTVTVGDETCAYELLTMVDPEWAEFTTFVQYDAGSGVKTNGSEKFAVTNGMTVHIRVAEKEETGNTGSGVPGVEGITPVGPGVTPEGGNENEGTNQGGNENEGTNQGGNTEEGNGSFGDNNYGESQPNGEAQPDGGFAGKCKLTIDYNLEGYAVQTVNAEIGNTYSDYVGVPARGGYDFKGWFSSSKNALIADITKELIMGDDTIEAVWGSAKKFTITFIDERGTYPEVVKIKQVTYGSAIGALPVPAERDGYVFAGWKLDANNNKIITAETIYEFQGDSTAYATWKLESDVEDEPMNGGHEQNGKVYLMIFINGKTGDSDLVKKVDITKYADDNKITRAEAKAVAAKYVTAKAGYTLSYEGLFDDGLWWEYKHDPETDGKDPVVVNRDDGDDYVYVMVKNVKTVAADPSNPKTGDAIFAAIGTMASTAAAAAYLFLNKKRFVK